MPRETNDSERRARSPLLLIPALIGVVLMLGVVIFAWSHFAAKGPAPQADDTPAQVGSGQADPNRDAYTAKDFTEPDRK